MKKLSIVWLVVPGFLVTSAVAIGQSSEGAATSMSRGSAAPDNSKSNKLDPSNKSQTADEQKNNMSDIKITQSIRRAVMADRSLSTYAHNAKIVSVNGTVTLNGVVHNQAESDKLAEKAGQVVGSSHVVNKVKVDAGK